MHDQTDAVCLEESRARSAGSRFVRDGNGRDGRRSDDVHDGKQHTAQQEQQTQQGRKTYTEEQAQEMREAGTTQGRKGCKAVRINMAFPPEMHDFIRTMARVRGESITDFTNHVFAQYMKDNADLYERAKAFLKEF